ncbi:taurine dioxygenase, partial [Escherichia coli]
MSFPDFDMHIPTSEEGLNRPGFPGE